MMSESDERNVTLAEVKEMLEKAEESREELSYEQKLAVEHARRFARFSAKDSQSLIKDLKAIDKVDPVMAIRIVDLAPTHEDDIKALFAKSRINLDASDVQKVLETVAKYLPE
jgi:DNA-directed RNA polymerase subunit F